MYMKLFKGPVSIYGKYLLNKYVTIEDEDGNEYTIQMRYGIFKGVHDVWFVKNKHLKKIKIKSAYPPLIKVVKEIALLTWLEIKARIKALHK